MHRLVSLLIPITLITIFTLRFSQAQAQNECIDMHVINTEPLGYIDKNNATTGVHWDYLSALEVKTGLCINKNLFPYARIWESIKQGKHDGGIVFRSESRSNLVEYAAHIRTIKTVVIPANGIEINNNDDLEGLVIAKTRGSHLNRHFDQNENLTIVEVNNYAQLAKMLIHKRVDAVAGSVMVLTYQLQKYNAAAEVNLSGVYTLGEKSQWLQFSKKSPHINKIPILKTAIIELKNDGVLDNIMTKHYGHNWKEFSE